MMFHATKTYAVSIDAPADIDDQLALHDQAIYGLLESACELADAGEDEGALALIDHGDGVVMWEEDVASFDDAQILFGPIAYHASATDFNAEQVGS